MDPRRILLAISGGIAAYKAPELLRALGKAGHEVRCMLTAEAERFVSPLVLQSLSGGVGSPGAGGGRRALATTPARRAPGA